ncbi:hypothetical protein P4S72_02930 [Vibrio sp. PP-XX7]
MSEQYQVFQNMRRHKTQLQDTVQLENGTGLASWQNQHDRVVLDGPNHHTLSLYVADGYDSFLKTPYGWRKWRWTRSDVSDAKRLCVGLGYSRPAVVCTPVFYRCAFA